MKAYLCVIVKNEELDVAEWILFHLLQGFKKIFVFDNGSSDKTRDQILRCTEYGDVLYIYWPEPGSQNKAYHHAIKNYGTECDWMAFFDVDEFLVLPKHKYINNFLESVNHLDAIAINWRMFGSNGQKSVSEGLIIETFTTRALDNFSGNRHIKSIIKPRLVKGVVNPHYFNLTRKKWYSSEKNQYSRPNGLPLEWIKLGKTKDTGAADLARIHHYFTKSLEHYEKKLQRGNADSVKKRLDVFNYNDKNDIADTTIIELYSDEIKKIREIKKLLIDSGLI